MAEDASGGQARAEAGNDSYVHAVGVRTWIGVAPCWLVVRKPRFKEDAHLDYKEKMDKNSYIIVQRTDAPILVFKNPVNTLYAEFTAILSALPVSTEMESPDGCYCPENVHTDGRLSDVITALLEVLGRDYNTNTVEWEGEFEYLTYRSELWPSSIEIFTRLYSLKKPGAVLYGRVIRRQSLDRFLMWADD